MPIIGSHLNPAVFRILQKNISHFSQKNKPTQNTQHPRNTHKHVTLTSPPIRSKESTFHPIHLCLIQSRVEIARIWIWHRHRNRISPQYPFLWIRSHLQSGPWAPIQCHPTSCKWRSSFRYVFVHRYPGDSRDIHESMSNSYTDIFYTETVSNCGSSTPNPSLLEAGCNVLCSRTCAI